VEPHSEEAERAALGCVMLDAARVIPLASLMGLREESWYMPESRAVWRAAMSVAEAGPHLVNLVTVGERLRDEGRLEAVGGGPALEDMCDKAVTEAHAESYLDTVRKKWLLRRILGINSTVEIECRGTEDPDRLIKEIPDRYAELTGEAVAGSKSNADLMAELVKAWRDAKNGTRKAIGLETPWSELTELLCGLEEGVTIVAGRPSAGKTTLEDMLAVHAARDLGVHVGRVTLDASAKELLARAMCRSAGVSLPKLKFGYAGESNLAAVERAAKELEGTGLHFAERIWDIRQIRTWAYMAKSRWNIGLLTIDYVQQVQAGELGRSAHDDVARVTHVSRMLKQLALDLKIPVLVLAQLNREVEKENRAPRLSDLRDSGGLEQDCHKCVFVYRDMKKHKEMEEKEAGATKHKRPVWVNLMKHKDGETAPMEFWLYPPYFRFEPAAEDFADDTLPSDRHDTARRLDEQPQYWPKEEGEKKPAWLPPAEGKE